MKLRKIKATIIKVMEVLPYLMVVNLIKSTIKNIYE